MRKLVKRIAALCLSGALAFTNMGNTLGTVYASSAEQVDFRVRGFDFVQSIMDMIGDIGQGNQPVTPDDLDFTKGRLEKYYQIFFAGEGNLYEFYPEFENESPENSVRTFIRLPEEADSSYVLTGEEQLVFLYINGSEDEVSFSTVIEHEASQTGKKKRSGEKRMSRVLVKSYGDAFSDELLDEEEETQDQENTQADKENGNNTADQGSGLPQDGGGGG